MNISLEDLIAIYPEHLFLELDQEQVWSKLQQQRYPNKSAYWNAYFNYLCLEAFLSYIDAEPDLQILPKLTQENIFPLLWSVVNGTAINIGQTRLILIPLQDDDLTEFRIQREWIDLPNWAGHDFIAMQVNLEAGLIQVWGYATHRQFRQEGKYDPLDETYSLPIEALTEDLSVLWVVREMSPAPSLELTPVPTLETSEAEALLEKLGQSSSYALRLEVPFVKWGALLSESRWLQELYERRLQSAVLREQPQPSLINLGQWFQGVFEAGWQAWDEVLSEAPQNLSFAFRQERFPEREIAVEGVKLIDLGMALGNQSVALVVGASRETEQRVGILAQLLPAGSQIYLPARITLTLLSQSGRVLQELQARNQDNLIQLKRFTCPEGKGFRIRVSLDEVSLTEAFTIQLPAQEG